MSKRQQLVDALLARLTTITTANGYSCNIGANVGEWVIRWERNQLPAATLKDAVLLTEPPANRRSGTRERQLQCVIELSFDEVDGTPTQARAAIADVLAAVGTDPTFEQKADGTERVSEALVVDDNLTWLSAAQIVLKIIFHTPVWEA